MNKLPGILHFSYKKNEDDEEVKKIALNNDQALLLYFLLEDNEPIEAGRKMKRSGSYIDALTSSLKEKFDVNTLHGLTHQATRCNLHKKLPKVLFSIATGGLLFLNDLAELLSPLADMI